MDKAKIMSAKRINKSSDETNPYLPEYEDYCAELIPESGPADTLQGEVLRNMCRIMHDYYSNGFGNYKGNEAIFLEEHKDLFTRYMKNPLEWDEFFKNYERIGFGDTYELKMQRGYGYYDDHGNEEDDYMDIDEEIRYMGWNVDEQMYNIMDGIVKYIRLTRHMLKPNPNKEDVDE